MFGIMNNNNKNNLWVDIYLELEDFHGATEHGRSKVQPE